MTYNYKPANYYFNLFVRPHDWFYNSITTNNDIGYCFNVKLGQLVAVVYSAPYMGVRPTLIIV